MSAGTAPGGCTGRGRKGWLNSGIFLTTYGRHPWTSRAGSSKRNGASAMTITPPGPDERPEAQRPGLNALWTLVVDRFRDYLHWATIVAEDPRHRQGGPHEQGT